MEGLLAQNFLRGEGLGTKAKISDGGKLGEGIDIDRGNLRRIPTYVVLNSSQNFFLTFAFYCITCLLFIMCIPISKRLYCGYFARIPKAIELCRLTRFIEFLTKNDQKPLLTRFIAVLLSHHSHVYLYPARRARFSSFYSPAPPLRTNFLSLSGQTNLLQGLL